MATHLEYSVDQLATQLLDWVDENIGGLSVTEAEGLKLEFKRLASRQEPFSTPQPTIES